MITELNGLEEQLKKKIANLEAAIFKQASQNRRLTLMFRVDKIRKPSGMI
jgi:hypothetical protein